MQSLRNRGVIKEIWRVLIVTKKVCLHRPDHFWDEQCFVINLDAGFLCSDRAVCLCLAVCVLKSVFVFKARVDTCVIGVHRNEKAFDSRSLPCKGIQPQKSAVQRKQLLQNRPAPDFLEPMLQKDDTP